MRGLKFLFAASLAGALLWASAPEEVSIFTFTAPVELPGRVLPAGRYLFKLSEADGELNIVKIENPRENKVFGIFLVKPDYQMKAPSKPGLVFEQGAPGEPQAIKAWFYQGDKYGHQFLYRK